MVRWMDVLLLSLCIDSIDVASLQAMHIPDRAWLEPPLEVSGIFLHRDFIDVWRQSELFHDIPHNELGFAIAMAHTCVSNGLRDCIEQLSAEDTLNCTLRFWDCFLSPKMYAGSRIAL